MRSVGFRQAAGRSYSRVVPRWKRWPYPVIGVSRVGSRRLVWARADESESEIPEVQEEELQSGLFESIDAILDEEESLTDEWFEEDSIPGGALQETVALALGALLGASLLNIVFRLFVVAFSVAATALKYCVVAFLLVIGTLLFNLY